MNRRERLQIQIDELNGQLAFLNRIPEDKFPIGTILVFSASHAEDWYILKTAEGTWKNFTRNTITRSLAEWIEEENNADVEYFEVYELKVQPTPFFASS